MSKILSFLLLILGVAMQMNAQGKHDLAPCGTLDGKSDWLIKYQANPAQFPKSNETIYVPITIHIVGLDDGSGYFPVSSVLDAFCTLNSDYVQAGIQFFIEGEFNFIPNSVYYDHTFQQGSQMMNKYRVKNTINCYIVGSPAGNCGYSSFNRGIALAKSCMKVNDHTWAHEVGHYLSLPHTFYGWEGYEHDYSEPAPAYIGNSSVERMDGSNCETAGDGFCDTPPDYLPFRWNCNSQQQSNIVQHDPDGVSFRSDGSLFMSYSDDNCVDRFSNDQIGAMRANLQTQKASYLYNQTPADTITELPELISPIQGELVDYYQDVTFEWTAVAGATHYLIEISPLPAFPFVLNRYVADGTSFTAIDLPQNKTLHWRIRPFSGHYTCIGHGESASFKTGTLSSTQPIVGVSGWSVYPNPVRQGGEISVCLSSAHPFTMEGKLLTISGQALSAFQWDVAPGNQTFSVESHGLQPGMYLLQLSSEKGSMSTKVAVVK